MPPLQAQVAEAERRAALIYSDTVPPLDGVLAGRDGTFTTLFYPALVGTLVVPLVYPALFALPREPLHAAMFVALGALGGVGHFFLIRAHDYASASTLSPFIYTQLAAVLALGWFVFGHFPDGLALAGILAIAASGLALALRHRHRP